jgi:hypothetical protein
VEPFLHTKSEKYGEVLACFAFEILTYEKLNRREWDGCSVPIDPIQESHSI